MRYELHCNGQVFHSSDLSELLRMQKRLPEQSDIYKFIESKFPRMRDSVVIKPATKPINPREEVLPYNLAEKCFELIARGKTRNEVAKHMHCSVPKLRLTLKHYEFSTDRDEYIKLLIPNEKNKNFRIR